jgi:hypothetical protein
MTIAPTKADRIGLLPGVRNRTPDRTINIHEKITAHPCHARGSPQPKPYRFARNQYRGLSVFMAFPSVENRSSVAYGILDRVAGFGDAGVSITGQRTFAIDRLGSVLPIGGHRLNHHCQIRQFRVQ